MSSGLRIYDNFLGLSLNATELFHRQLQLRVFPNTQADISDNGYGSSVQSGSGVTDFAVEDPDNFVITGWYPTCEKRAKEGDFYQMRDNACVGDIIPTNITIDNSTCLIPPSSPRSILWFDYNRTGEQEFRIHNVLVLDDSIELPECTHGCDCAFIQQHVWDFDAHDWIGSDFLWNPVENHPCYIGADPDGYKGQPYACLSVTHILLPEDCNTRSLIHWNFDKVNQETCQLAARIERRPGAPVPAPVPDLTTHIGVDHFELGPNGFSASFNPNGGLELLDPAQATITGWYPSSEIAEIPPDDDVWGSIQKSFSCQGDVIPATAPIDPTGKICVVPPNEPRRVYWFSMDEFGFKKTTNIHSVVLLEESTSVDVSISRANMQFPAACTTKGCPCNEIQDLVWDRENLQFLGEFSFFGTPPEGSLCYFGDEVYRGQPYACTTHTHALLPETCNGRAVIEWIINGETIEFGLLNAQISQNSTKPLSPISGVTIVTPPPTGSPPTTPAPLASPTVAPSVKATTMEPSVVPSTKAPTSMAPTVSQENGEDNGPTSAANRLVTTIALVSSLLVILLSVSK